MGNYITEDSIFWYFHRTDETVEFWVQHSDLEGFLGRRAGAWYHWEAQGVHADRGTVDVFHELVFEAFILVLLGRGDKYTCRLVWEEFLFHGVYTFDLEVSANLRDKPQLLDLYPRVKALSDLCKGICKVFMERLSL